MGQKRVIVGRIKVKKLKYCGHISQHIGLEKDIMLGPNAGKEAKEGSGLMIYTNGQA